MRLSRHCIRTKWTFLLHGRNRQTPLEEQCKAAKSLYTEGKFKRLGVDDVQKIYDICKQEGHVLLAVYQGGYNLISRAAEEFLFPLYDV